MTANSPPGQQKPTAPAPVWVWTTYFAEGFPYAIVINVAAQFFTGYGASIKAIGLTSLFHLPWNLKAFVGPFLDQYSTKRRWIVAIELLLTLALLGLAFTTTLTNVLTAASVMFLVLAIFSATHDIAIDGFYLETLTDKEQEALVGIRVPAYRVAMLLASGPLVVVAGTKGWDVAVLIMAAIMAAHFVFHLFLLPRAPAKTRPFIELVRQAFTLRFLLVGATLAVVIASGRAVLNSDPVAALQASLASEFPKIAERLAKWGAADFIGLGLLFALSVALVFLTRIIRAISASKSDYAKSFANFLEQPYAGRILVYIVLFRVGESFLMQMKVPFFQREMGMTQYEYGVINGSIGMVTGIVAPVIGGLLIGKFGFRKCIWPFLVAQNGLHLVFAVVALYSDEIKAMKVLIVPGIAMPGTGLTILTAAILIEIIGAGLGTAAFMVFIIRCCRPDHKAAHMALLTSLMSISFTLAGVFSGFLAEAMGFTAFFAFTFVVTLPGMIMTLWVPHIDERGSQPKVGV